MARISRKKLERGDLIREIVLYWVTVFGVFMSPFIPHLVQIIVYSHIPDIQWQVYHPVRIVAILFVALLMRFLVERDDNSDAALEGKRKNFRKRVIQHLGYGAMWSTLLEGILEGVAA